MIGAVAAIPAHLLLSTRNVRWTWALIRRRERLRVGLVIQADYYLDRAQALEAVGLSE